MDILMRVADENRSGWLLHDAYPIDKRTAEPYRLRWPPRRQQEPPACGQRSGAS
jgi:hypothetical protein